MRCPKILAVAAAKSVFGRRKHGPPRHFTSSNHLRTRPSVSHDTGTWYDVLLLLLLSCDSSGAIHDHSGRIISHIPRPQSRSCTFPSVPSSAHVGADRPRARHFTLTLNINRFILRQGCVLRPVSKSLWIN